jgi:predicted phosphodiesterase
MFTWTESRLRRAQKILGQYAVSEFRSALAKMSRAFDHEVSQSALHSAFARNELGAPTSYCKADEELPTPAKAAKPAKAFISAKAEPMNEPMQKLIEATKKKAPVSVGDLCDKLDMAPSKLRALIVSARAQGIEIHVEHDHVGLQMDKPSSRVQKVGVAPVIGERQKVAVISDTHLGSKYCLRAQLREFIHYAYSQGVREILHPGDVLDGMYRHGMFEVSHVSVDDQAQDLFDTLPQLPGLTYHGITGNHDFTFTEHSGLQIGPYLTNYFRERGRNDLHFYGNRSAFLKVRGAVVHLWHPKKNTGFAKSYAMQKNIEKYSSGEKPNILLVGHWHIFCQVEERAVHGIACPTFQGGGSAFSKSLGGAPAIGGLILSWDLTRDGTMRSFAVEKRSYFEEERPYVVGDEPREEIRIPQRQEPKKRINRR